MKKTELVFVLDRSGSMDGKQEEVIGGFNNLIKDQKQFKKDKATVTTAIFDNVYTLLHDRIKLDDIKPITDKEYYPRGMTALFDAIGKTILTVSSYMDKNSKVLFVITTDGKENDSKEFTFEQIKDMIQQKTEEGWKFIFLGAGVDAFTQGKDLQLVHTYSYSSTSAGTTQMYNAVSETTRAFRKDPDADLDTSYLRTLTGDTE